METSRKTHNRNLGKIRSNSGFRSRGNSNSSKQIGFRKNVQDGKDWKEVQDLRDTLLDQGQEKEEEDSSEEDRTLEEAAAEAEKKRRRLHAEDGKRHGINIEYYSPDVNFENDELDSICRNGAHAKGWTNSSITWMENLQLGKFRINRRFYPHDTRMKFPPFLHCDANKSAPHENDVREV